MKTIALLIVLVALCGCASSWDVGKGNAEIRRLPDPGKE